MSNKSMGVDAQFVEGGTTPFEGPATRIIREAEEEILPKESSKSFLKGPRTKHLGPEKGRLDRLHAQYKDDPSESNLNSLLAEVERYSRRVIAMTGGAHGNVLNQSPTDQYPTGDISHGVAIRVWQNLGKFDGKSRFRSWVFRITKNIMVDAIRKHGRLKEDEYHDWKYNNRPYEEPIAVGNRAAAGKSANGEFEVESSSKAPLVPIYNDPGVDIAELREQLYELIEEHLDGLDYIVAIRLMDGYTPARLAKVLNEKPKAIYNRIQRVKRLLKEAAAEADSKSEPSNVVVVRKERTTLPAPSQAAD